MLDLTEPVRQSYVRNAVSGLAELALGLCDALLNDVAIRRRSERFLKRPLEMPFAQSDLLCQAL